ncbi:unnamed protein product [Anisakis simplex]|uniref:ATPase n=1 Tax=Anisakis simplex TaxID=6269 RepID=A0A0M3JYR9_ANISI|nr:unnamed protein product [Anisakis simplex]
MLVVPNDGVAVWSNVESVPDAVCDDCVPVGRVRANVVCSASVDIEDCSTLEDDAGSDGISVVVSDDKEVACSKLVNPNDGVAVWSNVESVPDTVCDDCVPVGRLLANVVCSASVDIEDCSTLEDDAGSDDVSAAFVGIDNEDVACSMLVDPNDGVAVFSDIESVPDTACADCVPVGRLLANVVCSASIDIEDCSTLDDDAGSDDVSAAFVISGDEKVACSTLVNPNDGVAVFSDVENVPDTICDDCVPVGRVPGNVACSTSADIEDCSTLEDDAGSDDVSAAFVDSDDEEVMNAVDAVGDGCVLEGEVAVFDDAAAVVFSSVLVDDDGDVCFVVGDPCNVLVVCSKVLNVFCAGFVAVVFLEMLYSKLVSEKPCFIIVNSIHMSTGAGNVPISTAHSAAYPTSSVKSGIRQLPRASCGYSRLIRLGSRAGHYLLFGLVFRYSSVP